MKAMRCLQEEEKEEWHLVFNGALSTMEVIAKRGVRVLNVKTWRWQVLSKTAQYKVVEIDRFIGSDGQEYVLANLMCNENLRQMAGGREGLII